MEELDLNPTDNAILDMLREGRCTPSHIATEQDYSRGNIKNRLDRLAENNVIKRLDRGLYELVEDPREKRMTPEVGDGKEPVDVYAEVSDLDEMFNGDIDIYAETFVLETDRATYTFTADDSGAVRIEREEQ